MINISRRSFEGCLVDRTHPIHTRVRPGGFEWEHISFAGSSWNILASDYRVTAECF